MAKLYSSSETMLCFILKEKATTVLSIHHLSMSTILFIINLLVPWLLYLYPHINSINPPSSKSKYHRRNNSCKKKISRNSVQLTCETFFTRKNIKH